MKRLVLDKLGGPWPLMVVAVLALWLLFTVVGAGGLGDKQEPAGKDQDAEQVAFDSQPVPVNRAIDVEVKSFRIQNDEKSATGTKADMTLEIFNRSDGRADFRPAQLTINSASNPSISPSPESAVPVISVSPKFPVLAPVEFDIDPDPGAAYSLDYQGETIFSGRPR